MAGFIWPLNWIFVPNASPAGNCLLPWPLRLSRRLSSVPLNSGLCAPCSIILMMESFWATLKTECFHGQIPLNFEHAQALLFDYIETFYNPTRLHSSLGYLSPIEFENSLFSPTKRPNLYEHLSAFSKPDQYVITRAITSGAVQNHPC